MVLLVEEVDLVCQLADRLLVELMSVLDTENLKALSSFIELLEALDLFFPHVELLFHKLEFVFNFLLTLLSLLELVAEAITAIVGLSKLLCPLVRLV